MGILEPILSVACCPSVARMLGFCRTRVSASESSALSVPPPMVTAKLVALMLARVFSVKPEAVAVAPVVEVEVVVLVELGETCGVIPNDCGSVMPRLRILSRLT